MKWAMKVERINWVSIDPPGTSLQARVRIRYKHEEGEAVVHPNNGSCIVEFAERQRAITPGQAAVFYDGALLLGGGWITQVYS